MIRNIKGKLILILLVIGIISCQQDKTKILIIGDSISIGYTPFVQANLKDVADISHNPGNAQHTGTGLDSIETWIGNNDWDIIQINWGLWDLCYRHPDSKEQGNRDKINGKITYDIKSYGHNLDSIVKLIRKKSDAELIFVTTTYVPDGEAGRFREDAIKYNDVAKRIMESNNIKVIDIYEKSIAIHEKFGKDTNDVHYTKKGYEELALQISDYLKHEIEIEELSNRFGGCYATHNISSTGWNSDYYDFIMDQDNYESTLDSSEGGLLISYKKTD